jgi:hypothetical protein
VPRPRLHGTSVVSLTVGESGLDIREGLPDLGSEVWLNLDLAVQSSLTGDENEPAAIHEDNMAIAIGRTEFGRILEFDILWIRHPGDGKQECEDREYISRHC